MNIIEKEIESLTPYENNPRINDEAVKFVAESIKQFGFKNPIVIDRNGVIVAGHTRYKAAQELGMQKVPCIAADDLTDEQVAAFRLADNKVGEIAEWDYDMLRIELEDLPQVTMEDLGFLDSDMLDLDEFFNDYEPEPKKPKTCTCPHCGETFERKK